MSDFDDPHDLSLLPLPAIQKLIKAEAFGTAPATVSVWLRQNPEWWKQQLIELKTELDAQIARGGRDKDWDRKVKPLLIKLNSRLGTANALVKESNRRNTADVYNAKYHALLHAVRAHQMACPDTDDPDDIELYRTASTLQSPDWQDEVERMRTVQQTMKAMQA